MKREFNISGIEFFIGGYTPRNNEFECGLKYELFVKKYDGPRDLFGVYLGSGARFATIKAARDYARENIYIWL